MQGRERKINTIESTKMSLELTKKTIEVSKISIEYTKKSINRCFRKKV